MPISLALYSFSLILSYAYTSSFSCFFNLTTLCVIYFLTFELGLLLSMKYYFQYVQYLFLIALFVDSFESIRFLLFVVNVLSNVNYTYYKFQQYQNQQQWTLHNSLILFL